MKFALIITTIALVALSGCETTPFQKKNDNPPVELLDGTKAGDSAPVVSGLTPALSRRFRDVPLPKGLNEDTERTFVYDSKTTQVARMVYYTRDSLRDLAQFYIKYAPDEGWKLVSTTQVDQSVTLLYTKAGRRLDISVNRQGVGRSNKLVIVYLPED